VTSPSKLGLRGYQVAAHEAVMRGFADFRKQLLVLPTGGGKTVQFAHLAAALQPKRTLVLAHREELISQAVDKIHRSTGLIADVEMAEHKARPTAPVVVASIQTLARISRRERWPRDHFGLVVVDEAHHALAESYVNTLHHFDENAFVLGVTATPDRGDKKSLGRYFENIAYEITLLDLIQQNWLAPIRVKTLPLEIDLGDCRTTAGDWNAEDVGHAIEPFLERIADVLIEHRHRKTIVFHPLVSLSHDFARMCCERGLTAEHVDGQSSDRAEILARFSRGETRVLSNAMLLTEGYDEPSIDCVVCLRPTKVRALYSQIVGRGTRLYPGKDHLLVLDFLWMSEQHSLIRPGHLIASDSDEADAITEALGIEGDLEKAKEKVAADHAAALRQRLAANKHRNSRTFDPIEFALTLNDATLAEFTPTMEWHFHAPSTGQCVLLTKLGFDPATVSCKGQAAALIDRVMLRRQMGLATLKQVRWLRKLDHPQPELATFEEASAFLDQHWGNKRNEAAA